MKLSVSGVGSAVLLLGIVKAQIQTGTIPSCAATCLGSTAFLGGCAQFNITCYCTTPSYINGLICCVQDACNNADLITSIFSAQTACKQANITNLIFPPCQRNSTTSQTGTATESSTSSMTSQTNSVTSNPNAAVTSPAPATSSAAAPASSGLSKGAIAGIAVSSIAAGVAVIAALTFCLLRRRQKRLEEGSQAGSQDRNASIIGSTFMTETAGEENRNETVAHWVLSPIETTQPERQDSLPWSMSQTTAVEIGGTERVEAPGEGIFISHK